MHLRMGIENDRTLCGADPHEGSQSLAGLRLQEAAYRNFPRPMESDYCAECWHLYQAAKPALDAFAHLTPEEKR